MTKFHCMWVENKNKIKFIIFDLKSLFLKKNHNRKKKYREKS